MKSIGEELANHLLEDGEREPEKGQFGRAPLEKWLKARESYRHIAKLRAEAARLEDQLGYHITLGAELARHGLHAVDVENYIHRDGLPPKTKEWFDSLGLNAEAWKRSQSSDIVGAVTKDGQTIYFEEPVADSSYQPTAKYGVRPRRGLPYRVIHVNDPEGYAALRRENPGLYRE